MAEKKSNGFKTFLLIFITVALAVFLGCAAFLIMSPNSSIFGIRYRSNTKTETIIVNSDELLKFSKYSVINIDIQNGKGHTAVSINAGEPSSMNESSIVYSQKSSGFQYVGASEKYVVEKDVVGTTLNLTIKEPEYNFVQITNNSVLNLNIFTKNNFDSMENVTLNIKTGGGSVVFGGQVHPNSPAKDITINNTSIETTSGNVTVNQNTTITGDAVFKSGKGSFTVSGDKTLSSLSMETTTGKITTNKINGNVNLKTFNSVVTMDDITGKIEVEMESGILNLKNIYGNFISQNKIKYTTVNADTITGETTLINDEGNFAVNIKKTMGATSITTGNKGVTIGEACGASTRVITQNGSINVKKNASNAGEFYLQSKGNGSVNVVFDNVLGKNTIITNSGRVVMKFGINSSFMLSASSEKSNVYLQWLDETQKTIENRAVPPDALSSLHTVNITNTSGGINIERF